VYTVHVQPTERRPYWKRIILGWLLAGCTSVTGVSKDTANRLDDVATPVPAGVSVIYGGAEINARADDDPAVRRFRARFDVQRGPLLCQIGLNYPLKVAGVLLLLESLRAVRQEFPTVRLMLIGEGSLRQSVADAAAKMGLAHAVILTGYQADISVPLTVADIYCHITLQDAAPLSLLEAMSCGKPIVAARMGGIPELVRDGIDALLVTPEPAEIAQAIIRLLRHPDQAEALSAGALESARMRFSWNRAAAEFATLYGLSSDARK
jgi:glycosyltransferase involved in cell wall biosynthesis